MATNKLRVELEGKDKTLGRTMRGSAKDADTFRGKLKLIGQGLKQLIHGDFRGLGNTLKTLGSGFGSFGRIAAGAMVALGAAITATITIVLKAKRTYEDWMQQLDDLQDVTGMSAKATSLLAFQARMADTDVSALGRGVAIFTKTLDAARQGTEASLEPFQRLGVDLKDQGGKWRDLSEVLSEARDKLSEVEDQTTRNAIAAKLFGRGFKEMADWLDKSATEMRQYTKWAAELGMVIGEKSMKAFQDYRKNQRKLSVGWDAIKINAYAALVPLINDIMPSVINLIWKAGHWLGRFRDLIEKKGWGKAFEQMVPGGKQVIELLKTSRLWWAKNGDEIEEAAKLAGAIFKKLGQIAQWYMDNKKLVKATWQGMADGVRFALAPLFTMLDALERARHAMEWILGHGDDTGNAYQGSGKSSATTTKAHGRAWGGPVFAPASGEPYTLHGRETVVAHKDPRTGLEDLAKSGIIGGGDTVVNVYLDSEPIAARVEVRQQQRARRSLRTAGVYA